MIRYSCFVFALVFSGVALAAPKYARDMPTRPIPLSISSNPNSGFSVEGQFVGTYQVHPGYIEVNFDKAWLLELGSASNQKPRMILQLRVGIAGYTGEKTWQTGERVPFAAANKVLQAGETLLLSSKPVRIPISNTLDLAQRWLVVEIGTTAADSKVLLPSGVCYAHSKTNLFASAR